MRNARSLRCAAANADTPPVPLALPTPAPGPAGFHGVFVSARGVAGEVAAQGVRVHAGCQGAQGVGRRHGGGGLRLLRVTHRVVARVAHAGAGQDVVELVEEEIAPGGFEVRLGVGDVRQVCADDGSRFGGVEQVFAAPVGPLLPRLRRVTAGEDPVALAGDVGDVGRAVFERRFRRPEEVVQCGEGEFGEDRPGVHLDHPPQVGAGGAAAVIADAVEHRHLLEAGRLRELHHRIGHNGRDGEVWAQGHVPLDVVEDEERAPSGPIQQ